ncbi:MAG TPA: hypothetical protein VLS48_07940, partial [Anaerolineales bacterium]|nr:hypothetical protein [Anaerolineales bacterium]
YEAEQMRRLAEGQRDRYRLEAEGRSQAIVLEGEAEARVILLKAQAQAEALRLVNQVLQQNPNLITYQYVEKLGPGVSVMLVPNDNPFLLPLPDLTNTFTGQEGPLASGLGLTGTLTNTLEISPTLQITPTLSP